MYQMTPLDPVWKVICELHIPFRNDNNATNLFSLPHEEAEELLVGFGERRVAEPYNIRRNDDR